MNDFVDMMIKRSGAMWDAGTFDRTFTPVVLIQDLSRDGRAWELRLPPGEGHPYWRIEERAQTESEWWELLNFIHERHCSIGQLTRYSSRHSRATHYLYDAYVRDGRRPGWNVSGHEVLVTIEEL